MKLLHDIYFLDSLMWKLWNKFVINIFNVLEINFINCITWPLKHNITWYVHFNIILKTTLEGYLNIVDPLSQHLYFNYVANFFSHVSLVLLHDDDDVVLSLGFHCGLLQLKNFVLALQTNMVHQTIVKKLNMMS